MNQNYIIQIHEPEQDERFGMKRCFTFLGGKECHTFYREESSEYFYKSINKRIKAYNLVPEGAIVIPKNLVPLFRGWFIGGVLEDSLYRVYGVCHDRGGITGYSCSVYWVPTKDEMESITVDMSKVHGDFDIKTSNIEEVINETAT